MKKPVAILIARVVIVTVVFVIVFGVFPGGWYPRRMDSSVKASSGARVYVDRSLVGGYTDIHGKQVVGFTCIVEDHMTDCYIASTD